MSNKPIKTAGKEAPKALDRAVWLLMLVLFAAAMYANYSYFADLSTYIRIAGWIVLIAILMGLSALTQKGKQALEFLKAARVELRKVSWPTRQETIQTTGLIIVMIVVVSLVLWGVDSLFMWIVGWLTGQRG